MRIVELLFVRELPVSPEVLWPWVSEAARISAWAEVEIAPLSPGPGGGAVEAGATRTVRVTGVPGRMEERLVEVVDGERLVYSVYKGGGIRWHEGRVELEAIPEGCRLTWSVAMEPAVPGVGWVMRRMLSRQFERGLDVLAGLVEPLGAASQDLPAPQHAPQPRNPAAPQNRDKLHPPPEPPHALPPLHLR
ncbi:MAG: hypothetical protein ACI8RZ_001822 [Myxococcota bacterium]|jgi:uncharacterized protein YndB with AHSA1/START domain